MKSTQGHKNLHKKKELRKTKLPEIFLLQVKKNKQIVIYFLGKR